MIAVAGGIILAVIFFAVLGAGVRAWNNRAPKPEMEMPPHPWWFWVVVAGFAVAIIGNSVGLWGGRIFQ